MKKLVLILFVDGMSNYLSNNLHNSLNYFSGNANHFSKVFSNAPWTIVLLEESNYGPIHFYSFKLFSKIILFK